MDNKSVIENLTQELEVSKEDIKRMLNSFCKVLADKCIYGDTFIAPGFGQFEGRKKMERLGNHPASGKRILIPPKLVISFKPSAILKSRIQ